jgi:hypothetical protein
VFVDSLYFVRKLCDSMQNRKICVFRKPRGITTTKIIIMFICVIFTLTSHGNLSTMITKLLLYSSLVISQILASKNKNRKFGGRAHSVYLS